MNWQIFIAAFGIGLLSSFHCVGMCGAIAFSIPSSGHSFIKKAIHIVAYNLGRIITYACLGVVFGLLGRQINILGFQRWFSIVAGVAILICIIQANVQSKAIRFRVIDKMYSWVQQLIGLFIKKKSIEGVFLLGMANGLLPCGLVYLAITGALAAGTIAGAAGFMASFGLGTLPAMFLVSYFGVFISVGIRNTIKKAMPFVIAFMAVMLILRGIGLGIPILSPSIVLSQGKVVGCH